MVLVTAALTGVTAALTGVTAALTGVTAVLASGEVTFFPPKGGPDFPVAIPLFAGVSPPFPEEVKLVFPEGVIPTFPGGIGFKGFAEGSPLFFRDVLFFILGTISSSFERKRKNSTSILKHKI